MELKEKISYEFQRFYLDQMRTSKENIFAHSAEIEIKKQLVDELYIVAESVDESTITLLVLQDNLLESVYCFVKDIKQKQEDGTMKEAVQSWLRFVVGKKTQCMQKSISK